MDYASAYHKNIYRIKHEIQLLDDAFYAQDNWHLIDPSEYMAQRKVLCDELEEAYKA